MPLPHPEKIRLPQPLTIRCLHLCLAIFTPQPNPVSSRENHSVTSRVLIVCRMKQSVGCCVLRVAEKLGRESMDQLRCQYSKERPQMVHDALLVPPAQYKCNSGRRYGIGSHLDRGREKAASRTNRGCAKALASRLISPWPSGRPLRLD